MPGGNTRGLPPGPGGRPWSSPLGKACAVVRRECDGWLIIESLEGLRNLQKIVKTPGIDAVGFGAFDLSQEMGLQGQTGHPKVRRKIEEGISIALGNNVSVHMHLFEVSPREIKQSVRRWAGLGASILTCMTTGEFLATGLKRPLPASPPFETNLEEERKAQKKIIGEKLMSAIPRQQGNFYAVKALRYVAQSSERISFEKGKRASSLPHLPRTGRPGT